MCPELGVFPAVHRAQTDSCVVVLPSRRARSAVKQLIDPRTQKKIQVFSGGKKQLEVRVCVSVCVCGGGSCCCHPPYGRAPTATSRSHTPGGGVCAGTGEGIGH
jgi:hypothetical protein